MGAVHSIDGRLGASSLQAAYTPLSYLDPEDGGCDPEVAGLSGS